MNRRIRKKLAKQSGLAMDYAVTDSTIDENGARTIHGINLLSISIVPKEQAPIYLINGKRMWYPIGSMEPVEVDW